MSTCRNCLITDRVEGILISDDHVCNVCREYRTQEDIGKQAEEKRLEREADLEKTLAEVRGQGQYDCVVPFSGGKDSTYQLYKLKHEYKLRILAFTVNANRPDVARRTIARTVEKLDVDHISWTPREGLYNKLFRYILRNQESRGATYSVSYVYAPLFEGDAIKLAMEKSIPLVLAGYSPGQPEPERMEYAFSRQLITSVDWTPPELRRCGEFSEEELSAFYNPTAMPAGTEFPRYLAPFHAWEYNQEEVMDAVVRHKLVEKASHANPINSNYPINWLLMYSDLRHFGYNPYLPEFAGLIREGKANRNYWKVMVPVLDFLIRNRLGPAREVTRSLSSLGMTADDLAITKPRGAYDPIIP